MARGEEAPVYPPVTYARHDTLGLYVRFGDLPIASYTSYKWGGVYYRPTGMTPYTSLPYSNNVVRCGAQAFDVHPWFLDDLPVAAISALFFMTSVQILEAISSIYDYDKRVFRSSASMKHEWFSAQHVD